MAYEPITIDHAKMGGLPCIRGLRIPVSIVLGELAARLNAHPAGLAERARAHVRS